MDLSFISICCAKHALIIFIFFPAFVFPIDSEAETTPFTIIYSANLDGELEPCKCSESSDYGGVQRRTSAVDQLRNEVADLILISSGGLLAAEKGSDRIKNKYILKGLSLLNYDAAGLQWADLVYGVDFLEKGTIPFIVSNRTDGSFAKEKMISRRGAVFYFYSWLDHGNETNVAPGPAQALLVSKNAEPIQTLLKNAKKNRGTTILSTALEKSDVEKIFNLEFVDILLVKSKHDEFGKPEKQGKTLVLRPGASGMRLGRLDVEILKSGDVAEWKHSVIRLGNEIADPPSLKQWYENYKNELRQDYLKRVTVRKDKLAGVSPYMGEAGCGGCHAEESSKWKKTKHADAFKVLVRAGKEFDETCVSCHSAGFGREGGFLDRNITPHLMGVQCESCHGPGRKHADSNGSIPTANSKIAKNRICPKCHDQHRNPNFSFKNYWGKIAH